uniref:Kinesin motor domain-containing protein n=1 Tax=Oryzias latipes TaxID=8090 RepID=A0A3B3HDC1_ORYLA
FRKMTEESAVKVCVRVRPLVESFGMLYPSEMPRGSSGCVHRHHHVLLFFADRVFTAEERTDQLYRDIAKPLVVSTVGGYNGTIFAYGQTCSGKTFTMMGSDHAPGVIPLAMEDVFQTITTVSLLAAPQNELEETKTNMQHVNYMDSKQCNRRKCVKIKVFKTWIIAFFILF